MKKEFGEPPHSIIIPANLHFTELDSLKLVTKCLDEPFDNSASIKSISEQMIEKYVPMVRKALEEIKPLYNDSKEFQEVFENEFKEKFSEKKIYTSSCDLNSNFKKFFQLLPNGVIVPVPGLRFFAGWGICGSRF